MDNQELLSLLNENAKTKEEVLREQEAEELRKQQKEKLRELREQQNIRAFDQLLCNRFKERLVEVVRQGLFNLVGKKRVVKGCIEFRCPLREDSEGDYYEYYTVELYIENECGLNEYNSNIFCETNAICPVHLIGIDNYEKMLVSKSDYERGFRNLFMKKELRESKTGFLNKKTRITEVFKEDEEALESFISFFNSELSDVAKIIDYSKYSRRGEGRGLEKFRRFFFKAEF